MTNDNKPPMFGPSAVFGPATYEPHSGKPLLARLLTCVGLFVLAHPCTAEVLATCHLPSPAPQDRTRVVWNTMTISSMPWSVTINGDKRLLDTPTTQSVNMSTAGSQPRNIAETLLASAALPRQILDEIPLPPEVRQSILDPQAMQLFSVRSLRMLDISRGKFGEGIFIEAFDAKHQRLWYGISLGLGFVQRCENR